MQALTDQELEQSLRDQLEFSAAMPDGLRTHEGFPEIGHAFVSLSRRHYLWVGIYRMNEDQLFCSDTRFKAMMDPISATPVLIPPPDQECMVGEANGCIVLVQDAELFNGVN